MSYTVRRYWKSFDEVLRLIRIFCCRLLSQNALTPLQTAPATALPQHQPMSASQLDLHSAVIGSSSNLNDSRNSFIEQRPYRLIQDLPQSRHSPSHFQPTGYLSQNQSTSNYPAPGVNTERCSPTRSGRVRNRVRIQSFNHFF